MRRMLVALGLIVLAVFAFAEGGSEAKKAGFNETGLPIVEQPRNASRCSACEGRCTASPSTSCRSS